MITMGEKIKDLRKNKNMTQDAVAMALNVSRQAVAKWESNQAVLNKCPIFVLSENLQKTCEQAQKGALNLAEIQHQDRHGDHMSRSLPQLCSDQPHAAFTFRQTESVFRWQLRACIALLFL